MLELPETILEEWAKESIALIQDNIRNYDTKNYTPRAQREEMAATVRYEVDKAGIRLYAGKWIFTYEYGRGPTVNDGDGAVRRNVLAYLNEENIKPKHSLKSGVAMSQSTLAYFISKSIHEKGTLLHRLGKRSGVLSDVINKDRIDKLKAQMLFHLNIAVRSTLLQTA